MVFLSPAKRQNAGSVYPTADNGHNTGNENTQQQDTNEQSEELPEEETIDQTDDQTASSTPQPKSYNLNTMSKQELLELPQIGETRANEIISLRNKLGGFFSLEQLKDANGIGESIYQKILPYLYLE